MAVFLLILLLVWARVLGAFVNGDRVLPVLLLLLLLLAVRGCFGDGEDDDDGVCFELPAATTEEMDGCRP
jgi:hypothetical protein